VVFFDSGGTPVGQDELRRVLRMEEEVGDEGSQSKMKGFTWRRHSPGRWSQRRHLSLISMALTHFLRPALDETQGSGSMEVSECSDVDARAQSGGTVNKAQGDSFTVVAVSREKGGGPQRKAGAAEAVAGRANRRGQRKGGPTQWDGWRGGRLQAG
jgi:hypothetical protein